MKRLRNMMFEKRKTILYLSFIVILSLGFIGTGWGIYSQAAGENDIWLEYALCVSCQSKRFGNIGNRNRNGSGKENRKALK